MHDNNNERVDEACRNLVWGQASVKNWYQNKDRRVFANSPWRLLDYWRMTHKLEPSEYALGQRSRCGPRPKTSPATRLPPRGKGH